MRVSPLGWGAAGIGYENIPDKTVDSLLGVALDQGLNVIDTAECYMDSEEKLGRVLRGRRQQCLLFTKCGHAPLIRPAGVFTRAGRKLWRPVGRALGRVLADWDPRLLNAASTKACAGCRPIGSTSSSCIAARKKPCVRGGNRSSTARPAGRQGALHRI